MSKNFDLNTFTFNAKTLRTVTIDGEPWFSAPDVLDCLGHSRNLSGSASRHLRSLSDDERRLVSKSNVPTSDVTFPNRGQTMLSECGLYKVILRAQRSNPAGADRRRSPRVRSPHRRSRLTSFLKHFVQNWAHPLAYRLGDRQAPQATPSKPPSRLVNPPFPAPRTSPKQAHI